MKDIKRVGVLTSGGDAPGMNAAVRAVVRTAIYNGLEPFAIYEGYKGIVDGDIRAIGARDVGNIIQRGGTILKSARCKDFHTKQGREKAAKNLLNKGIDALVVIGGDGSFCGAKIFSKEFNIPIIGIPGTIDNDLYGTDYTIGFDTAVNTVVEAVDKIRDTASAHDRLFFVEVMGRDAGCIALQSAVACGAEAVLIPEVETHFHELEDYLKSGFQSHKSSGIVIVSEGEKHGGAYQIAEQIGKDYPDYDIRVTILGHIQRGGSPSCYDRVVASRLGVASIEALLNGEKNVMVGIVDNRLVYVPFEKAIKNSEEIPTYLLDLNKILSI